MKRFNSKKNLLFAVSMSMLTLFAFGCADDDNKSTMITPDMGTGAMVRVVHASPDAPSVDVYAEGVAAALITGLEYGETSDYLDLAEGTYNIQLRAAGSPATSAPAFETGDLTIPDGARITAAAVGLLGSSNADDKFRVVPLVEGFVAPGSGNAAVRIIHASADAPTVALDIGNDGAPEISNFARFADTGEAGVPLPAATELQIAVWAGSPLSRVTVFTTPQLPEGAELFVFATGLLGKQPREADGFNLLAVGPTGTIGFIKQNPVVFALHGSPDAPPVDIYAGTSPLATNLAFGKLSGAIQVPPASYTLSFRATGSATEAASATTPTLAAGERYLAIATGFLGSTGVDAFTLLPLGDAFDLDNSAPQVRVVHASPDAPTVDVGPVSAGQVSAVSDFSGLSYKDASTAIGTVLPNGALTIGVAAANDTSPVASFSITTSTGLRAFAVAAGSFFGNGETFRLVVVDTSVYPWQSAEVSPLP